MPFVVTDSATGAIIGNLPTPALIQEGGGRAWRDGAHPRTWYLSEYGGRDTTPAGFEVREVTVRHTDDDPYGEDEGGSEDACICVHEWIDDDYELQDHPYLEAVCPGCADPEVEGKPGRRCTLSDCVCYALRVSLCSHCARPAYVVYRAGVRA